MKLKVIALPLVAGSLLLCVYLLPRAGDMAPSAISMDLPAKSGGWFLQQKPPSKDEILLLAADTEFSKATCLKAREGEFDPASGHAIPDRIDLSIVLSGHNLNDSIHRPERCMPAQGHAITGSSPVSLELTGNRTLPLHRLLSVQSIAMDQKHLEYRDFQSLTYYFFVGHSSITSGHYERTFIDMKDRLVKGMDQRWAYVSVTMWYGDLPWLADEITFEEADRKLREFIKELAHEQIDWEMIGE